MHKNYICTDIGFFTEKTGGIGRLAKRYRIYITGCRFEENAAMVVAAMITAAVMMAESEMVRLKTIYSKYT